MRCLSAVCVVCFAVTLFAGGNGGEDKDLKGLAAHYFKDHKNWKGHWPDDVSVPDADPNSWTFTEYSYSRVEPVVNHLFIKEGWFSVRWVGYLDTSPGKDGDGAAGDAGEERTIKPASRHDYTFEILADDGCRLFIDGKKILDDWRPCWEKAPEALRKSKPVKLAGGKHRIVVEYFQGQSLRREDKDPMKLYWSCSSRHIPRQIIPASHLSHTREDKKNTDGR